MLRLIDSIPLTADAAGKVIDFARAVVVDPVVIWARCGAWSGVMSIYAAFAATPFNTITLVKVHKSAAVVEIVLLREAVACLFPALCASSRLRFGFANVLRALVETNNRYFHFGTGAAYSTSYTVPAIPVGNTVGADPQQSDGSAGVDRADAAVRRAVDDMRMAMKKADSSQSFTPAEYQMAYADTPSDGRGVCRSVRRCIAAVE